MASAEVETVRAVLEAIGAQDADRAVQHVDPRFVQHSPHVADGVDGLRRYITESPPEGLRLAIVRTLQDGPYVVAQLKAAGSGPHVFAVYRFEGGRIAEHWAFSSPDAPPNQSGHTQLDGPTEPTRLEDTAKNVAIVRRYYETFHVAGDHSHAEQYFKGDLCVRHEPGVRDGVAEFTRDVEGLMRHRTIDEVKLSLGEGDFVFIAANGTHDGGPCAYIDLYRVEDEKIVEHWGFPEKVPPRQEWRNTNGPL